MRARRSTSLCRVTPGSSAALMFPAAALERGKPRASPQAKFGATNAIVFMNGALLAVVENVENAFRVPERGIELHQSFSKTPEPESSL